MQTATSQPTDQSLQKSLHLTDPKEEFQKFYPTLIKKIKTRKHTSRHTDKNMTKKLNADNGLQRRWTRTPAANSVFMQLGVKWLNQLSISHQHLWYIDSESLRNPQLHKHAKRYRQC